MGTRALTFVYDEDGDSIINLYRQFDGYPSGHGFELAEFLVQLKLVNGIRKSDSNIANGMGCLAAQLVARFKTECGNFYLHSVSNDDLGQDFEYHIYHDKVVVKRHDRQVMFTGSWNDFYDFCYEPEAA